MPPFRLRILRKPALRKKSTASAERFPLRQCATISREESSSWTRRVSSPSGSRCPLRLQIWYSWGSRTSRMNKSSPRSSRALSSRGVISGTCTVGPGASFAAHAAEFVVINQLGDRRMRAAHGAIRIFAQLELAEFHSESVEKQQAPHEIIAAAKNQLDRFHRLDGADDSGQNAEDARLPRRKAQARRRRFG